MRKERAFLVGLDYRAKKKLKAPTSGAQAARDAASAPRVNSKPQFSAEESLGELRDLGIALPLAIAKRMRRFDWTTDLRYETGRRDTGETKALLKTAKAIYNWAKGQMP